MQAVGIVCEYNPFHSGHLYQMERARALTGTDTAVICVMSGDFVQRGEAALFDKFTRAEAACRCGADLVVELPLPWCLSSAEGFASGAVALLAALECGYLSFGSESGDLQALEQLADFLSGPASTDRIRRKMELDSTLSFARARQLAAQEVLGDISALLSSPNDILAVEYLKANIKYNCEMKPLAIRREGASHDVPGGERFRSAMELRDMIGRGEDPTPWMPEAAAEIFAEAAAKGKIRDERLMETALLSRLYRLQPEDFDTLPDAGGGTGRRLRGALWAGYSLSAAARCAATKRYTTARMRRMLLCAALGVEAGARREAPPYLRILACTKKGRELLRERKDNCAVPILVKPAAVRQTGEYAERVFSLGAQAHDLYAIGFADRSGYQPDEDWRRNPVIV